MLLDESGFTYNFYHYVPFWLTRNADTARSLLTALAGGLISLMVFSFTMVMVVLNQASSNYTPRALPGLISQKSHQVVLGIYLGSIGFTITVLTNIEGQKFNFVVPELALVVNAFLGFCSFIAFVYFIHSISQKIQLGNILSSLYHTTINLLKKEQEEHYVKQVPDELEQGDVKYYSPQAGYFHSVNTGKLVAICHNEDIKLVFLVEKGAFLLETTPMFKSSKPLSEKLLNDITNTIIYRHQEDIQVNYLYGFKQITEMALRALSPGINDPATAIQAIDYLSHMFALMNQLNGYESYQDNLGISRLYFWETSFEKVYYLTMGSIRNYSGTDITVQLKLLQAIKRLLPLTNNELHCQVLISEQEAILENCRKSFNCQKDIEIVSAYAEKGLVNII
jgi:uncharacterized membrane protein